MSIYTLSFWKDAFERAVKTAAQSVILALGLGEGLNFFAVDWTLGVGFALGGFALSVLSSIVSAPVSGSASLVR